MSLLLATGILAIGGLGLFMYKSNSENDIGENDYDNDVDDNAEENTDNTLFDNSLFDISSFFGLSTDVEELTNDEEPQTKKRNSKAKNVKKTGGTKRRY